MTEPDFSYDKKPQEPSNEIGPNPTDALAESQDQQAFDPPLGDSDPNKYTCQTCGKVFNTKEELTMHTETAHQSPKKEI